MKALSLKVLRFEKSLLYGKTRKYLNRSKRFFFMIYNYRDSYCSFQSPCCFTLFKNTIALRNSLISVCFHGLILGTVYQTTRNSLHYRRTAEQTDSLDLIKMIKVTRNVNQPNLSDTNKRKKIRTSIPYGSQSQKHASGRD